MAISIRSDIHIGLVGIGRMNGSQTASQQWHWWRSPSATGLRLFVVWLAVVLCDCESQIASDQW